MGELYIQTGKAQKALLQFEKSLKLRAGRVQSLLGAARAGKLKMNTVIALKYYRQLLNTPGRGPDLLGLSEAKKFLKLNSANFNDVKVNKK